MKCRIKKKTFSEGFIVRCPGFKSQCKQDLTLDCSLLSAAAAERRLDDGGGGGGREEGGCYGSVTSNNHRRRPPPPPYHPRDPVTSEQKKERGWGTLTYDVLTGGRGVVDHKQMVVLIGTDG